MQTILERTGDSNWYIKHTNFNDTPERSAAWVKSLKCDSMSRISDTSTYGVKRLLRSHGMRECYTSGGANILYCGYTAFRLINDYTMEVWCPLETESGVIKHYDSVIERNEALTENMGVL